MNNILVTSYIDPDLDGTAGSFAYAEYLNKTGRNAVGVVMGQIQIEAEYVFQRFNIKRPLIANDTKNYNEIIFLPG